jgi:phosphoribosylformylglycinamidine synthase
MTLSVPKVSWKKLKAILDKHGTEATVIGRFTAAEKCVVRFKGKKVMDVDMEFLHEGRPETSRTTRKPKRASVKIPARGPEPMKALTALLSDPNIGSYSFISDIYDHEVQSTSVTKPLQGRGRVNADAGVIRPREAGKKGVVLSQGYAPSYSSEPYRMAAAAIDTAVRNAVAAGASLSHLAILDNFCWSSSDSPERLWQLKEAARACYDYAIAYGTPFISGKDSMYNDFRGFDASGKPTHVAVLPTLLISTIGVMEDAGKAMTFDAKASGDLVYLIGKTRAEFGGSEYAKLAAKTYDAGTVPVVSAKENHAAYRAIERAIGKRLVSAALGLSRGGLGVAAAKMAIAGNLGMRLTLSGDAPTTLFSESQGRMLVTVAPKNAKEFETLMKGVPTKKVGVVTDDGDVSFTFGRKRYAASLTALAKAYRTPFKSFA